MKTKKFVPVLVLTIVFLALFASCQGLFAPDPTITKFQHEDFSYGTTHDISGGDILSFVVEGEMPSGAGSLEVIADKDGTETVLLEQDIATEEIAFTSLQVQFSLQEAGTYEVFARATSAETAKIGESSQIKFDVSVASVEGLYVEEFAVAKIDDEFALNTRTLPIRAPDEDVSYTSSKPDVVSVNGETLTAVAGGIATITATTVDTGYTAEAKIYVEPSDADGGMTNPWVWDANASSTTQEVNIGNLPDYYLTAVTGSALYMAFDGEADSIIEFEVRDGIQWTYGTNQGSGSVDESATSTIASDLEPGFYMLTVERQDDGTSMNVDLSIWGN